MNTDTPIPIGALGRIALRNVVKNWRHSLAAMLSIAAGFVALGLFEGYMADLRWSYEEGFSSRGMLADVIVEKGGGGPRDEASKPLLGTTEQAFVDEYLLHDEDVLTRVRFLHAMGVASTSTASSVFFAEGYDVPDGARVRAPNWAWNTTSGKPLQAAGPNAVVMGRGLGIALDCDVPEGRHTRAERESSVRPFSCKSNRVQLSATTASGQLNAIEPELSGFIDAGFKELDARYLALPLPLAQQLMNTSGVSMYSVKLKDSGRSPAFIERMRAAAHAARIDVNVISWKQHPRGEMFQRSIAVLKIFRNFVTAVVTAVAGMSVLNALTKAVSERTREIGALRSLGFRRREIVLLFSLEGGGLALVSILIGLAVTLAAAWSVNHLHIMYRAGLLAQPIPFTIGFAIPAYITGAIGLFALSVLAAFIPARRASRLRIADALGHV